MTAGGGPANAAGVLAVFAYGTLRGDYAEDGDRWGVLRKSGGSWRRGLVRGFKLYQQRDLHYPFAVATGDPNDVLVGTLLEWPSEAAARRAIDTCNRIESFDEEQPEQGLYQRAVASVELFIVELAEGEDAPEPLAAFVYHQPYPNGQDADAILSFPCGDWLGSRRQALTGSKAEDVSDL